MSKRDLVYVLVIMTGFSTLLFAIVLAVTTVITAATYSIQHQSFDLSLTRSFVDLAIRVIISIIVIRKADRITSWLLREPKA